MSLSQQASWCFLRTFLIKGRSPFVWFRCAERQALGLLSWVVTLGKIFVHASQGWGSDYLPLYTYEEITKLLASQAQQYCSSAHDQSDVSA